MPPVTANVPSSSQEQAVVVVDRPLARPSSSSKKSTGKKRKATSTSTSPSSPGEAMELVDADERAPARKVRKVTWMDLEPVVAPAGTNFELDNIDSLWYRQLDYGPFLRQQLVTQLTRTRLRPS